MLHRLMNNFIPGTLLEPPVLFVFLPRTGGISLEVLHIFPCGTGFLRSTLEVHRQDRGTSAQTQQDELSVVVCAFRSIGDPY